MSRPLRLLDEEPSDHQRRFERDDLVTAAFAVGLMFVARIGWTPPIGAPAASVGSLLMALAGLRSRRRWLVVLAVVLFVSSRSASQTQALERPLTAGGLSGSARLVTDPVFRRFDVQAVLDVAGRRYVASALPADSPEFKSMMAGEKVWVEGAVGALEGAPPGWVRSNHLAGRLKLKVITRAGGAPPWYRLANDLRRRIERSANSMDPDERALYLGLVIGDDRTQSELQRYRFKASGLSHLLAVSGQNVSFVLSIASPILRRAGPRLSVAIATPVLVLFALVTRAEPSVLRAVVMSLVALLAICAGREIQGLRMLALTVVVLVAIDPLISHSIGFQLSVAATFGLILLAEPFSERLPGPAWLREPLAVTLAAQIATAPILFGFNSSSPSVATLANLAAVPLSGFVMMGGLTLGLFAGSIRADVAGVLMFPLRMLVRSVDRVAALASQLPLAPLTPLRFALFVGFLVAALGAKDLSARTSSSAPITLRTISCVALIALVVPRPPGDGRAEIPGGAQVIRSRCDTALIVGKGADGLMILEALSAMHVNRVGQVWVDSSRSAQRAAALVAEQHRVDATTPIPDGADPSEVVVLVGRSVRCVPGRS